MADDSLEVACPECGKEMPILVGNLRKHGDTPVRCRACGHGFKIDATEVKAFFEQLAKAEAKLGGVTKINLKF